MWRSRGYSRWAPYVPVAQRRAQAAAEMAKLCEKGLVAHPVSIEGRTIARSFWGKAWCDHLEKFSDYANRLPRGRRYVRNGSVCHLEIARGTVRAKVSGSEIYDIDIAVKKLPAAKWKRIKSRCSGRIGSLLELLQGSLSGEVMEVVTDRADGMFPHPREISLECNCPDWATMCKHVAAVLYGVGARLDEAPELLFALRGVDHQELIDAEANVASAASSGGGRRARIAATELSDVFGIELSPPPSDPKARPAPAARAVVKKPGAKRRAAGKKPGVEGRRVSKKNAAKKKKAAGKKQAARRSSR